MGGERVNWPMNLYVNSIFTVSFQLAAARWDEECQSVFLRCHHANTVSTLRVFEKAIQTGKVQCPHGPVRVAILFLSSGSFVAELNHGTSRLKSVCRPDVIYDEEFGCKRAQLPRNT